MRRHLSVLTKTRPALLALLLALAWVAPADAQQRETPEAMLERAIQAAGGAEALERARALTWSGRAVAHRGNLQIPLIGTWAVRPPDTAVVATYRVDRGPSTTRTLVLAGRHLWSVTDGESTILPDARLANESDAFYLYDVMRLVSLRDSAVILSPLHPDSRGQPGFRADRPGRPVVDLHFAPDGRLPHIRTRIRSAAGGGVSVGQDLWLSGTLEAGGIRCPAQIRIVEEDLYPFLDLTLSDLKVLPRLDDPRLRGP